MHFNTNDEVNYISTNLKKQIDKLNQDVLKLNQLKQEEEARVYELQALEASRKKALEQLNAEQKRYNSMITMIKHDEAGRKEYIELFHPYLKQTSEEKMSPFMDNNQQR